jgi:hypothetical protein
MFDQNRLFIETKLQIINEIISKEFEEHRIIQRQTIENQDKIFITQTDNWS